MNFFQATKLAFELTMLHSQTQCELWLEKNKVVFKMVKVILGVNMSQKCCSIEEDFH